MSTSGKSLLQRHLLLTKAAMDPDLSKGDVAVLAVILTHLNDALGTAWPGRSRISSMASIDRSTVVRAVKKLQDRHYLKVVSIRGKSNKYSMGPGPTSSTRATSGTGDTCGSELGASARKTGLKSDIAPLGAREPQPVSNLRPELSSLTQAFELNSRSHLESREISAETMTDRQKENRRAQARLLYQAAISSGNAQLIGSCESRYSDFIQDLMSTRASSHS